MTIGNTTANSVSPTEKTHRHHKPKEIQDLESALKSGDLDAAKKAFTAITDKMKQMGVTTRANSRAQTPVGGFAADIAAIGKALDSGDISGALNTLSAMESHRPHGPHGGTPLPPPQNDPIAQAAGSSFTINA